MNQMFPPEPFPPKGVIFDCDGVVVDSRQLCRFVYNHLREKLELKPLTQEQEEFVFVNTAEKCLQEVIPAEHLDWAREAKGQISPSRYLPLVKPNPGIRELLATLKRKNIPTALNTNGGKRALIMLKAFGLEDFFTHVVTARDVKHPKPHPEGLLSIMADWGFDPHEVVFVGDSPLDSQAAQAAGVAFWSYGPNGLERAWHLQSFEQATSLLLDNAA